MDAKKKLIEELNAKGAKFSIHTDIAYGKGINGIGYNSYVMYEERGGDGIPKTKVYRTFEPKDAYVVIHEKFVHPEIPWNKNIKACTCEYNVYIAYDRITYINETIKTI
jgi:hypothetical protein